MIARVYQVRVLLVVGYLQCAVVLLDERSPAPSGIRLSWGSKLSISKLILLNDKISPQSSESYSESEGPSSESENSTATLRARIVATSERPWKSQVKIKIPFMYQQVPNVIYLSFLVLFILFSFCLLQCYSIPVKKKQIIKKRRDMKENEMIILSTFTDPACFQK